MRKSRHSDGQILAILKQNWQGFRYPSCAGSVELHPKLTHLAL